MRQIFHLFLFKVVAFCFFQLVILMFHSDLAAAGCCDGTPQPEVMEQSPNKKYAAIITPRYHIRSIAGTYFEIYQDHITLTFAEQILEGRRYEAIWKINIDDPGNDYMGLSLTNSGYVLVISDSYTSFTDNEMLKVFNLRGKLITSYTKSMVLTNFNSHQEFNTKNLNVEALENMFILHYSNKFLIGINCETGNIILKDDGLR